MKTMQTVLACSVLVLLVAVLASYRSPPTNKSQAMPAVTTNVNFAVNASDPLADPDNLQAIVPDGKELSFAEFQKRAPNVAQLLSPLKPTHIKRTGNRFNLTNTPATISKSGVTVYVSGKVSCEATKSGNIITLKNIDGVEVDVGVGKMKLKEAVITPGANDTAKVDGKLEVSRWLPYVPFSITVDTK